MSDKDKTDKQLDDEFDNSQSRANNLLAFVQKRTKDVAGKPDAVLAAVDEYCYSIDRKMMHVGDKKGAIVRNIVKELAPVTCLELGTYCGYSAILLSSVLPKGSRYITLEADASSAAIARQLIDLAGTEVSEKITVVNMKSEEALPTLKKDFSVDTLDFVFIDHWKSLYLRDLKHLEELGLLRKGTVIVADNILFPGAPDYLHYVQTSKKLYMTELIKSTLEYSDREDALTKSVYLAE